MTDAELSLALNKLVGREIDPNENAADVLAEIEQKAQTMRLTMLSDRQRELVLSFLRGDSDGNPEA